MLLYEKWFMRNLYVFCMILGLGLYIIFEFELSGYFVLSGWLLEF